jgi:chaperone modulatory protein CbpM
MDVASPHFLDTQEQPMNDPPPDCQWLDTGVMLTAAELARCCGLPAEDIDELVAYGAPAQVIEPRVDAVNVVQPARRFSSEWVGPLRSAAKLRDDFDIDLFNVSVLVRYLKRIDELEREVQHLRAQLPGHHLPARHGPGGWREGHGTAPAR